MATKKSPKISKSKNNYKTNNINYKKLIESRLKKKYLYLLFGLTIFILGYFLITAFFYKNKAQIVKEMQKSEQLKTSAEKKQKTYVTKTGDYLWKIAEENYGSGYNAYDIAKINNIENPNIIYSGVTLKLPDVAPKSPTQGEIASAMTNRVTLTDAQYTVKSGDYLWKIALEAYGDGYAWTRIAKANNLQNPDIIHPGTLLNIPR